MENTKTGGGSGSDLEPNAMESSECYGEKKHKWN